MTTLDFIREHADILAAMGRNGITPNDVVMLPVVEEYHAMKARGFKVTFTAEYLAYKHGVSIANIYRAVKKFKQNMAL